MKTASISEVKKELIQMDSRDLAEICLRMAKFKKENKELLTYLLFEANDEAGYVRAITEDITDQFEALRQVNLYQTKKSLRKILRVTNKQIRFSGQDATELALRIHFCKMMVLSGIPFQKSPVLVNLFTQQQKKINEALARLPEDLQLDYARDLSTINKAS